MISTKCSIIRTVAMLYIYNTHAAPEARYTHWKQTVFYIQDCITVKQGEQLSGLLSIAPNPRNKVYVVVHCNPWK